MQLSNAQIAEQLVQLAELLRNRGEDRFKVKAYRNAARSLRNYPERVSDLAARGESLTRIPGVGKGISAAIHELLASGSLPKSRELSADLPPGAPEIAGTLGISIRDANRIIKALGVSSVTELREKMADLRTGALDVRMEVLIRRGLEGGRRLLWYSAREMVEHLRDFIAEIPGIARVDVAGSFRRGKDTVGTLAFVAATPEQDAVLAALRGHAGLQDVAPSGDGMVTAQLATGLAFRLRFADEDDWGEALVEETGSPAHLREVAHRTKSRSRAPSASEEEWYKARGLPWIPPELREGRGEVAAALEGRLPDPIALNQIRGDLHSHTTASDGANTLEEMARAARAKGYEYLGVTDHSRSLKITRGLDEQRLREQMAQIDQLNKRLKRFRVFKGSEVDILQDGSLDFPDEVLRDLDIVICSVHSRFALGKAEQTERIIRAIENPNVTCVGHLTGRLLLKRPGYELDTERILRAVKANGKLLEINSSPDRLDIDDELAIRAREAEIPLLINTDAHSVRELEFMALGVQQGRRGWQTQDTVWNTLPLARFQARLRAMRPAPGSRKRRGTTPRVP